MRRTEPDPMNSVDIRCEAAASSFLTGRTVEYLLCKLEVSIRSNGGYASLPVSDIALLEDGPPSLIMPFFPGRFPA
jgi:hypothetical protein